VYHYKRAVAWDGILAIFVVPSTLNVLIMPRKKPTLSTMPDDFKERDRITKKLNGVFYSGLGRSKL
jgi:hypothetical protein